MGIKDLSKVIAEHAASAMRTNEMKAYFGRKVAIDASMSLYQYLQFLIAIRHDGGVQLLNQEGETTSHLNGMFYRTIRMMENGLKPAFIFDGKPPVLKADELDKRTGRREENKKALEEAKERGDTAAVEKFQRRLVKVSKEHSEECKRLLQAMGVPVVDAPCEAEAQCAELVRAGKVYAAGTEDMDALTFGSKILLRHLTFSETKKEPIKEYFLDKILSELDMSKEQFIDLCILLGCDYCPNIKGIGPKKAVDLIKKHKNIETILENIDQTKYPVPEGWLYKEARVLFLRPEVTNGDEIELNWTEPDTEEVVKILVTENGFNEDRVRSALDRLVKSRQVATQGRIDTFFKSTGNATSTEPSAAKRKKLDAKTKAKTKSGKGSKSSSAKKK